MGECQNAKSAGARCGWVKITRTGPGTKTLLRRNPAIVAGPERLVRLAILAIREHPPRMPKGYRSLLDEDGSVN